MTQAYEFTNNHTLHRPCSKAQTLLRMTDTFDSVCYLSISVCLYASLSRISKAIIVKRTLLQKGKICQASYKRQLPYADTNKNFRKSKKQRIKIDIFVNFFKKKHFLHFKITILLVDLFLKNTVLLGQTLYRFSKLPSASN